METIYISETMASAEKSTRRQDTELRHPIPWKPPISHTNRCLLWESREICKAELLNVKAGST
jgi:hypothetical protein